MGSDILIHRSCSNQLHAQPPTAKFLFSLPRVPAHSSITGVITKLPAARRTLNLPAARSTANGWCYATEHSSQGASNFDHDSCTPSFHPLEVIDAVIQERGAFVYDLAIRA